MCGGVYSPAVLCRDYLDIVHRVVRTPGGDDRWAYSTSVELSAPVAGTTVCTFVVIGSDVVVLNDRLGEFNFEESFSRRR